MRSESAMLERYPPRRPGWGVLCPATSDSAASRMACTRVMMRCSVPRGIPAAL